MHIISNNWISPIIAIMQMQISKNTLKVIAIITSIAISIFAIFYVISQQRNSSQSSSNKTSDEVKLSTPKPSKTVQMKTPTEIKDVIDEKKAKIAGANLDEKTTEAVKENFQAKKDEDVLSTPPFQHPTMSRVKISGSRRAPTKRQFSVVNDSIKTP